jgi:uncharacterized protein YigE (DUF2233 family)
MVLLVASALAMAGEPVVVTTHTWKGARWVVAEVDLTAASIDLVGQREGAPSPHTLARTAKWATEHGRQPLFATNAGIYMEDRRPLGLHIEAGHTHRQTNRAEGYGNFYLMPNGVFRVDADGAAVVATDEVPATVSGWTLATQSGPLLVRNQKLHPQFDPNSTSLKTRSFVGIRDSQHIVLAVSLDRVRFHDTGTFARDRLGCSDALYLDGSISNYWTPDRARVEGDPDGYGGVLVVSVPAK